jgi:hypothetical protein
MSCCTGPSGEGKKNQAGKSMEKGNFEMAWKTHRSALIHRPWVQMVDAKQGAIQVANHIAGRSNIPSHSTFDLDKFN